MGNVNKNIVLLRRRAGLTQAQLAIKLGIKRSKLGAFEEFRSLPRLKNAVKNAKLFEVNLNTLVSSDISKEFRR